MTPKRLEELLEAAGVEQQELAAATEVSEASVSRYVGGSRPIPSDFASKAEIFLIGKAKERLERLKLTTGVKSK